MHLTDDESVKSHGDGSESMPTHFAAATRYGSLCQQSLTAEGRIAALASASNEMLKKRGHQVDPVKSGRRVPII